MQELLPQSYCSGQAGYVACCSRISSTNPFDLRLQRLPVPASSGHRTSMTTCMVLRRHTSGDKKKSTPRREGSSQRRQSAHHRPKHPVRLPLARPDNLHSRHTGLDGGVLTGDPGRVPAAFSMEGCLVGASGGAKGCLCLSLAPFSNSEGSTCKQASIGSEQRRLPTSLPNCTRSNYVA
jgi:hypothetical protein